MYETLYLTSADASVTTNNGTPFYLFFNSEIMHTFVGVNGSLGLWLVHQLWPVPGG